MLLRRRKMGNTTNSGGGSEGGGDTVITFSVEFPAETKIYQALEGMTWNDFVNSDYNVGYNGYKFYIESDIVWGKTSRLKEYPICATSNTANSVADAERGSYIIIPNGIYNCKLN